MGQSVTYANGTTLVSSALTAQQIDAVLQPITLDMLGLPVTRESRLVRVGWPIQGQPFVETPKENITFLRCTPKDDPYDKIRDIFNSPLSDPESPDLQETWTYTRVWNVHWTFYGDNSVDSARIVRSALYQWYFTDKLQLSQLFPMSEFPQPTRMPENINGQWYDRSDLEVEMYEFITETINRQTILSVEVILENSNGVIADFTVE